MNKFKIIGKNKLYYDKYKYRSFFSYPNMGLIRYAKTEKDLDRAIELRKTYSFGSYQIAYHNTEHNRNFFLNLINWRNSISKKEATIRIDFDCISVYSNNLDIIQSLEFIAPNLINYTEVKLEGDVGTMLRKNPKHKYRTYFRTKTVPDGFHYELDKFLSQYDKSCFPTPSLKKWMKITGPSSWRLRYLDACFFIDYDNESFLSILSLNFGEYLGKTYKVERRD